MGREVFCKVCDMDVVTTEQDFGIGAYEYGSQRGFHSNVQECCPYCESGDDDFAESREDAYPVEPEMDEGTHEFPDFC